MLRLPAVRQSVLLLILLPIRLPVLLPQMKSRSGVGIHSRGIRFKIQRGALVWVRLSRGTSVNIGRVPIVLDTL